MTQFQPVGVGRSDVHCIQAWRIRNLHFYPYSWPTCQATPRIRCSSKALRHRKGTRGKEPGWPHHHVGYDSKTHVRLGQEQTDFYCAKALRFGGCLVWQLACLIHLAFPQFPLSLDIAAANLHKACLQPTPDHLCSFCAD